MKTKLKQFFKRAYVQFCRLRSDKKTKRPKNITVDETLALDLWMKLCLKPDSLLLYDTETHECYAILQDESHPIYLFLESRGLRIVNSTVGYTVYLSSKAENWCGNIFFRQLGKRRKALKAEALSRVTHSLESLNQRIHNLPQ